MQTSYIDDERFKDLIVSLCVKDLQFLRTCNHILASKDFKPRNGTAHSSVANAQWITAKIALAHFEKYRQPVKDLLNAELLTYAKQQRLPEAKQEALLAYGDRATRRKITAVDVIVDKLRAFKREKAKADAVQEMISLQEKNELTDEKWLELSKAAVDSFQDNPMYVSDYFAEVEKRIDRRLLKNDDRFPVMLIEPLDALVRGIARGHLGLVMAPYKRGKSLMLIYLAVAYVLQRLNVLYITLEDPVEDVEDRFDACITNLPIKKLPRMRKTLRSRFEYFKRLTRSRLKIYDGTERRVTIATIEDIWEEERNQGFTADCIIVDYDDEIAAVKKNPERRMEMADIYRDMRRLASKKKVIFWTAAQTKRHTENMKVLSGDQLAEDISKVRKVMLALSIGQGDWGPDSLYLWVAAHKFDRQRVGCNIMPDKERMLIYSREKTLDAMRNPQKYAAKFDEEG